MNTLSITGELLEAKIKSGDFCIDATAGNGHDTEKLCRLVGGSGRVLAFDIQEQAVKNTRNRLKELGLDKTGTVILDSHANMAAYAKTGTADCIVFNLGWLPGGDHSVFTRAETTIAAMNAGLEILKDGGFISVSIYYGGRNGYEERDALLKYLEELDPLKYTVLTTRFLNRRGDVPISAVIYKCT